MGRRPCFAAGWGSLQRGALLVLGISAGVLVASAPAWADGVDMALAFFALMMWGAGFLFVYLRIYIGLVALIEAYVLQAMLGLGFRRSFWYSFAANVVSATVSFLFYMDKMVQKEPTVGWKTTLVNQQ